MSADPHTPVRLAFVGDVALAGEFVARARPAGAPLTFPFAPLAPLLHDTEILVANLEGPLGKGGEPRHGVAVLIHNEPEVMDWLKQFPHSVCNLANNHMLDYGAEALLRTRSLLADAGIDFVGAGCDLTEAREPSTVNVREQRIGFLGYTTDAPHVGSVLAGPDRGGCASLNDQESVLSQVQELSPRVDSLVVSLHWGHEYFGFPEPDQVRFSRALIDAGATLVIGHHPHVQQGIEEYKGGLIAYSLGNLLLPEMHTANGRLQYRKPVTKQFGVLNVELTGRKVRKWQMQGGRCSRAYELLPYASSAKSGFAEEIQTLSAPLASLPYEEFWSSYKQRRLVELRREGLRDALAKLWRTDWETLRRTASADDLKRNAHRLIRMVLSRS